MTNDTDLLENFELLLDNKYLKLFYASTHKAIICVATQDFIPRAEFKTIFGKAKEEAKSKNAKKMIFDKRNLAVFDQLSMVWYHVVFKAELKTATGMITYRKLLPENKAFRIGVEVAKQHIKTNNPDFNFEDFDIQYVDSLEDALTK